MGICRYIALFILLNNGSSLFGQSEFVQMEIKKNDNIYQKENCVHGRAMHNEGFVEIWLYNTKQDTVHLFDSYLQKDFILSKYLHRVDKANAQLNISFLPITPFLGVRRPDVIILGEKRLIAQNQVLYHFTSIPPNQMLYLKMKDSVFCVDSFTKEIDLKKISRYDKIKLKPVKNKPDGLSTFFVFAVYDKINLLLNSDSFYLDEVNFNKQVDTYDILSIAL